MKQITILLIFVLMSSLAKADCLGAGTTCWPYGNSLNKHSIIIINTGDTNFALRLTTNYTIYLISKTSKIQLLVSQVCKGGLNLIQLVLKPATELVTGQEYGLFYANSQKKLKQIERWNSKLQKYIPVKWTVENQITNELPVWIKEPTIAAKFLEVCGCGYDEWIYFHIGFAAPSDAIVKAVVKNIHSGAEISCYIDLHDGKFQLGHNMCYGELDFDTEKEYEVIFYLIDKNGNISAAAKQQKFSRPDQFGWSN